MESITATERELSGLMEKGFFERAEPVKKGEYLGVHPIEGTPCILVENDEEMVTIIISRFGEMFSVKNEKCEKQWFCSECGVLELSQKSQAYHCKTKLKPLLVCLDKIEYEQAKVTHSFHYLLKTFKRTEE